MPVIHKNMQQPIQIYKINFAIIRCKQEERLSNMTAVKQKKGDYFFKVE